MPHRHRAHVSLPATLPWLMVATVAATTIALQQNRQPWGQAAALATADSRYSMAVAQAATPSANPSPEVAPLTALSRDVAWWPWILAFPGLGGLLWWVLRETTPKTEDQTLRSQIATVETTEKHPGVADSATDTDIDTDTDTAASQAIPAKAERRIILVPRSSHAAYAYWELPTPEIEALEKRQCRLALKVHDVTDIAQVDQQPPHATELWDCPTQATGDRHLTLAQENREYLLELGYKDEADTWHALVRSAAVRSPAPSHSVASDVASFVPSETTDSLGTSPAVVTADPPASTAIPDPAPSSAPKPTAQATLTPQTCRSAQAHWELSPDQITVLQLGNHRLTVRLYDVTELPGGFSAISNSMQTFEVAPVPQSDLVLPIAVDDRDYLIEVGYVTENGQWQVLAKSSPVRVPACSP